jgi:hypothetical protein
LKNHLSSGDGEAVEYDVDLPAKPLLALPRAGGGGHAVQGGGRHEKAAIATVYTAAGPGAAHGLAVTAAVTAALLGAGGAVTILLPAARP